MGRRNSYVHFGADAGLDTVLPGVTAHVLGPPNLEQTQSIRKQRVEDRGEFWLSCVLRGQAPASKMFPRAATCRATSPDTRWFVERLRTIHAAHLTGLVRALDSVLNNTSVILLFELGSKKLLFPGDAQIENWSYALSRPLVRKMLADVDLYKVGHHGSRNATPKSLWNLFARRSAHPRPGRLRTVVSTEADLHGEAARGTEVPRASLIKILKSQSDYFSTQDMEGKLYEDICIEL